MPSGANDFARLRALETVQFNFNWIFDKENEIIEVFSSPRLMGLSKKRAPASENRSKRNQNFKLKLENDLRDFYLSLAELKKEKTFKF